MAGSGGFLIGTDPGLRQTRTPTVDVLTDGVGYTSGSSTTITLSDDPGSENHVVITFDGVVQHHDTYSQSGAVITFDAAIPSGVAKIEAIFTVTVASTTVPDNSVTLAKLAGGTDGELITWDASGDPSAVPAGTATHVLTSNGAGAAPTFTVTAGKGMIQAVNSSSTSQFSTTTLLPQDDTIPQNTEGIETVTVAITPTSATNALHITCHAFGGHATSGGIALALFQDSTTNALNQSFAVNTNSAATTICIDHWMTAGTTSATTFKIRMGNGSSGTTKVNGATTRVGGGVATISLTVAEIEVQICKEKT